VAGSERQTTAFAEWARINFSTGGESLGCSFIYPLMFFPKEIAPVSGHRTLAEIQR
jgi:hypothetical protein